MQTFIPEYVSASLENGSPRAADAINAGRERQVLS